MSCEVSWFSALCDDDYEFLGVPDPKLKSSWEHCRDIVLGAEAGGFDNVLLPSGYALGIDATAFAAGIAVLTRQIRLLLAVRVEGVRRQAELRAGAGDEGYVEDNLWTGIGRAWSGCGAAIVGDPDQVLAKLAAYQAMGIEAFILSGYPHAAEADLFARHVLPRMPHGPLA